MAPRSHKQERPDTPARPLAKISFRFLHRRRRRATRARTSPTLSEHYRTSVTVSRNLFLLSSADRHSWLFGFACCFKTGRIGISVPASQSKDEKSDLKYG